MEGAVMWATLTPQEQRRRKAAFQLRQAARQADIEDNNAALNGKLPPWPQPRFLTPELEQLVAHEISERPLHGVPSHYRTEAESLKFARFKIYGV
jgi:hypothetical protein